MDANLVGRDCARECSPHKENGCMGEFIMQGNSDQTEESPEYTHSRKNKKQRAVNSMRIMIICDVRNPCLSSVL